MIWTIVLLIWLLNFAISCFNAWSVGRSWVETKAAGGWPRFLAWMGAIMSACGFTWCFLIAEAVLVWKLDYLSIEYVQAMLSLGYLVIILPILGSGLALTMDSWAYFWRRRNFRSGAVAGWNSFAQVYNTYQAVSAIPDALDHVIHVFSKKDSDSDSKSVLVILLVVVAILGGVLTTTLIIRATARSHAGAIKGKSWFPRANRGAERPEYPFSQRPRGAGW